MPERETEKFSGTVAIVRSKFGNLQSIELSSDRAILYSIEHDGVNSSVRCNLGLIDNVIDSDFHVEAYVIWDTKLDFLLFVNHLSGVRYKVPFQFGCWNMKIGDAIYHVVIGKNMLMVEDIVALCNQTLN